VALSVSDMEDLLGEGSDSLGSLVGVIQSSSSFFQKVFLVGESFQELGNSGLVFSEALQEGFEDGFSSFDLLLQ